MIVPMSQLPGTRLRGLSGDAEAKVDEPLRACASFAPTAATELIPVIRLSLGQRLRLQLDKRATPYQLWTTPVRILGPYPCRSSQSCAASIHSTGRSYRTRSVSGVRRDGASTAAVLTSSSSANWPMAVGTTTRRNAGETTRGEWFAPICPPPSTCLQRSRHASSTSFSPAHTWIRTSPTMRPRTCERSANDAT